MMGSHKNMASNITYDNEKEIVRKSKWIDKGITALFSRNHGI